MGKLQDYYKLFDMFKGKLTDEQKSILEGLEDQLIAEEILPAISESVAPVLGTLRRPLTLVVDYDPEGGITVKTTRGEVVVKENTAKKYQIPATTKVVEVAETIETIENSKRSNVVKRAPATGLCVWVSANEFIQENKAAQTMVKAIESAGASRIAALNIPHDGDLLVTKKRHPLYSGSQQPLSNGYYVNTHSSTEAKKRQLDRISAALHLGWKVEIIK